MRQREEAASKLPLHDDGGVGSEVRGRASCPVRQSSDVVGTKRPVASTEEIESGGIRVRAPEIEPGAELFPQRIAEPRVTARLTITAVTARKAGVGSAVLGDFEDVAVSGAVRIRATVCHGAAVSGAATAGAQLGPAQRCPTGHGASPRGRRCEWAGAAEREGVVASGELKRSKAMVQVAPLGA